MSGKRTNVARLGLESLDHRDLPSATVAFQGSLLVVASDGASDQVVVAEAGGTVSVVVNGQARGNFSRAEVGAIVFDGGAGDDVFVNATSVIGYAFGGAGNDFLIAGSGGSLSLGGTGDDILFGGTGTDYLLGEAGNDRLFGGAGVDVVSGGTGRDLHLDDDRAHDALDDRGTDLFDAPEIESADDRVTGIDTRGGNDGRGHT